MGHRRFKNCFLIGRIIRSFHHQLSDQHRCIPDKFKHDFSHGGITALQSYESVLAHGSSLLYCGRGMLWEYLGDGKNKIQSAHDIMRRCNCVYLLSVVSGAMGCKPDGIWSSNPGWDLHALMSGLIWHQTTWSWSETLFFHFINVSEIDSGDGKDRL